MNKPDIFNLIHSEEVLETIPQRIGIPDDDFIYREEIKAIYKIALAQHVSVTFIQIAGPDELEHFSKYMDSALKLDPILTFEDLCMEFVLNYPNLKDRIFATIPAFTDEFINTYKNIANS